MPKRVDVIIIGGGPAGMATALALMRAGYSIVVVEKSTYTDVRVGETLPPNARVPLAQLGVWERFVSEGYALAHGIRSVWGSTEPYTNDFIFNPYGHGWHLDRTRFDAMLACAAAEAGVEVQTNARLASMESAESGRWQVAATRGGETQQFVARFVVDATGRAATIARRQGAKRIAHDRLVGVFAFFVPRSPDVKTDSCTLIEAVADGWWYSAHLPDARIIVAYLSDSDLVRDLPGLIHSLYDAPHTRARLSAYAPQSAPRIVGANSYHMDHIAGEHWLAVGDAAVALDPLSGQGIYHALQSGLRAARVIGQHLAGERNALSSYTAQVTQSFDEYLRARSAYYAQERRWPDSIFWQRRQRREPLGHRSIVRVKGPARSQSI